METMISETGLYTKKKSRFLFWTYETVYFDDYKVEYGEHGLFSIGCGLSYIMFKRVNKWYGKGWRAVAFTYPKTHQYAEFEVIKEYLLWYEKR